MRRAAVALVAVAALAACTDVPTSEQAVELEPATPQAADPTEQLHTTVDHAQAEHDQLVAERARAAQRAARAARTTTTRPSPAARAAGTDGCGGWRYLIAQFFPPGEHSRACRILLCESGGNPNARNPRSTATGLFQILGGTTDPVGNVRHASEMWRARGWQPWVCR